MPSYRLLCMGLFCSFLLLFLFTVFLWRWIISISFHSQQAFPFYASRR